MKDEKEEEGKRVRVAVSLLNFRAGAIGGTETYLRELVRAMGPVARARGVEVVLVCRSDSAGEFQGVEGVEVVEWNVGDRRVIGERVGEAFGVWRARGAEGVFEEVGADVVLMPQGTVFPRGVGRPYVLVVHDLQHLERPGMLPRFDRVFRPRAFPVALEGAERVIAISEVVRKLLIARCGVEEERVVTVRHGAAGVEGRGVVPFRGVGGPFLYFPAATHRHKGHGVLLRTFAELVRERGYEGWKLVLSGQRTSEWGRIEKLIGELGLGGRVVHLGFVPFEEVMGVYAAAEAVVFPSEYEGLGLPVLEAGLVGKKIVTSRLEVFEELGVPSMRRIDFGRVGELKGAIEWEGGALERAVRTWEECAGETLDVLVGVLRKGSGSMAVTAGQWPVPGELQALIKGGRWPGTRGEVNAQNLKPLVPEERVRAFAPEEHSIVLLAPPFPTVRQLVEAGESSFWNSEDRAPGEISFDHAVVIGDFGLGSDAPIVLDYRKDGQCPSVLRLRWGSVHGDNHWVEVAPNFRRFAELLGFI